MTAIQHHFKQNFSFCLLFCLFFFLYGGLPRPQKKRRKTIGWNTSSSTMVFRETGQVGMKNDSWRYRNGGGKERTESLKCWVTQARVKQTIGQEKLGNKTHTHTCDDVTTRFPKFLFRTSVMFPWWLVQVQRAVKGQHRMAHTALPIESNWFDLINWNPFTHSLTHSFVRSLVRLFVHSFINSDAFTIQSFQDSLRTGLLWK